MVNVSGNNNNNRVSVKPVSTNNQVEATNNLAKYYSEISQDWAVGEGLIQNIDYSSKIYALQSKEYANDAKESMETTEGYMNNAISNIQTAETSALSNIVMQEESALSTVSQSVEQLNTTIIDGLENINTSVTSGVETIETLQANSLAEITTNKETALSDITTAETNALNNIDTNLNNATSEINTNRANTLAQISTLANTSISDINTTAKSYDNLTYRNITNCLLEVPQRIKYDLTDGTLTVKAGTVVIVPYRTEDLTSQYPVGSTFINENFKVVDTQFADGKFFVWVELQSDITASTAMTGGIACFQFVSISDNAVSNQTVNKSTSGTTEPTSGVFYNTSSNLVYLISSEDDVYSLPLSISTIDEQKYQSVNQVFNGMGYIGSTIWVDKGVKGLTAWGKNEDGTYKGNEYEVNTLEMVTYTRTNTATIYFGIDVNAKNIHLNGNRSYDEKANIIYNGTRAVNQFECGTVIYTSTGITALNPKQPIRLVNYNEFEEVITTVETYVNGTSWYRIESPDNTGMRWGSQGGYVDALTSSGVAITFLKPYANTNYSITFGRGGKNTGYNENIQWKNKTPEGFTIFCETSTMNSHWETQGHIG